MEAVVAIFLLAGGALACFTLLLQAFRYQGRSQLVTDATVLAEQTLEAVRGWASEPTNFDTDWSIYSNVDFPSGGAAGLVARVTVSDLKSSDQAITPAYRWVTVAVMAGPRRVVGLTGQVGSPMRATPTLVRVEAESGAPLPQNASVRYRAYLQDANSVEIPGVSFHWAVQSVSNPPGILPGLGTIESVGPNQALLTHLIYSPTVTYDPGWMRVQATCRYRGELFQAYSNEVELLTP